MPDPIRQFASHAPDCQLLDAASGGTISSSRRDNATSSSARSTGFRESGLPLHGASKASRNRMLLFGIAAGVVLSGCDRIGKTSDSTSGTTPGEQRTFEIGGGNVLPFRWAPAGSFSRSAVSGQADVVLDQGYWIAEEVITQPVWQKVMGTIANAADRPGPIPAAKVSLQECAVFLKRLKSPAKGWKFVLPSEDQWEYACRAGANSFNAKRPKKLAWINVNRTGSLQPAGIGPDNAWSIRDVNGNLSEWCADAVCEENAAGQPSRLAQPGIPGMQRGSSFLSVNRTGFRIVLVPDQPSPNRPAAGAGESRLSGL